MDEKMKEQVLEILQNKVKGYVKIENDALSGGWLVTIKHFNFNFSVTIFKENTLNFNAKTIAEYVIRKYKDEIISYYF